MIYFLFLFLFLFQSFMGFAVQEPSIKKSKTTVKIQLGKDLDALLANYNSFQAFNKDRFPKEIHHIYKSRKNQTPMVNIIDLNKDGKKDAVVMGLINVDGKPFIEVVALLSQKGKYELKPIKRWKVPNLGMKMEKGKLVGQWPYYILHANDYEHQYNKVPKTATAFKIEAYQSSTLLYYWNGNKFKFIEH